MFTFGKETMGKLVKMKVLVSGLRGVSNIIQSSLSSSSLIFIK